MKKILFISILLGILSPAEAQRVLSLDSCRALALRNNKQLNISMLNKEVAVNVRKVAKTKYLPKVDAAGTYQLTSKEISILNRDQKNALNNLGTNAAAGLNSDVSATLTDLTREGIITPTQAQAFGDLFQKTGGALAGALNDLGGSIRKAFRTNTRNNVAASILISQPIYMGGAITAANHIAEINERLADNGINSMRQATIYDIDQAYWMVVSLKHKQRLADKYLKLVQKLNGDVHKMINEGVATRADGLKVEVKVNEAEMAKTQVDDGVSLAKMFLCQLCGIDMNETIMLADEDKSDLSTSMTSTTADAETAYNNRPELMMLQNAIDISRENTKLIRAAYLPQIAAIGGYTATNPNVYNGFENSFSGMFHIGVMVRVPVWSWFEGRYKENASKAATTIAMMELNDAREKVELQVNQSTFKVREANKKYIMASKNTQHAEENLRCATLGFKEGVMPSTDVIAAQTAWLQAQTQKIDAEIGVKLSQVNLQKALGTLQY